MCSMRLHICSQVAPAICTVKNNISHKPRCIDQFDSPLPQADLADEGGHQLKLNLEEVREMARKGEVRRRVAESQVS